MALNRELQFLSFRNLFRTIRIREEILQNLKLIDLLLISSTFIGSSRSLRSEQGKERSLQRK